MLATKTNNPPPKKKYTANSSKLVVLQAYLLDIKEVTEFAL